METVDPVEPGYYATDPHRLCYRDFRSYIGRGGMRTRLLYVFRNLLTFPVVNGARLPIYSRETRTQPEELPGRCIDELLPRIAELERKGFRQITYQKMPEGTLLTHYVQGGVTMIHSTGEFIATVVCLYFKNQESRIKTACVVGVSLFISPRKSIVVIDTPQHIGSDSVRDVIVLPGASMDDLWARVEKEKQKLELEGKSIIKVTTSEDKERLEDEFHLALWHEWIRVRKVLVKMTDAQIEAARRRMPRSDD